MTYFGFIPKGRKYAEVIVTKEQGQRSTQVETGVTFPTFKAAEQAVFEKNMAGDEVTLSERIARIEAQQHLPSNVVPIAERRERRQTPRWIEWTRENERRGKSLDNRWGGDAA